MAHTQHGDDERKKRKRPPCPRLLVSIGPWLTAYQKAAPSLVSYCQPWPAQPPWTDPTEIPSIGLVPFGNTCGYLLQNPNDGTFPFWAIQIFASTPTPETDGWDLTMTYGQDNGDGTFTFYFGEYHLDASATPDGTYTPNPALSPPGTCQNPAAIAVTIIP